MSTDKEFGQRKNVTVDTSMELCCSRERGQGGWWPQQLFTEAVSASGGEVGSGGWR